MHENTVLINEVERIPTDMVTSIYNHRSQPINIRQALRHHQAAEPGTYYQHISWLVADQLVSPKKRKSRS
jgi:hypothetical protein